MAPLSMEFSRREYWSGLPFPSPRIFPTQGSNPGLLHYRQILYCLSHIYLCIFNVQICYFSPFLKHFLFLITALNELNNPVFLLFYIMNLYLQNKYLEMELLDQRSEACVALLGIARSSSLQFLYLHSRMEGRRMPASP